MVETNAFDLTQDPTNERDVTVEDEEAQINKHPLDQPTVTGLGHQSISAADYNPDDDRRLDDERQQERQDCGHKVLKPNETVKASPVPAKAEMVEEESEGEDEDEDDMFAVGTSKKTKKKTGANGVNPTSGNVPLLPVCSPVHLYTTSSLLRCLSGSRLSIEQAQMPMDWSSTTSMTLMATTASSWVSCWITDATMFTPTLERECLHPSYERKIHRIPIARTVLVQMWPSRWSGVRRACMSFFLPNPHLLIRLADWGAITIDYTSSGT